jgi:hypothetical protein
LNSSPSNSTLPTTSARANRLSRRRVTRNDDSSINNNNNNNNDNNNNTDVEETRINLKYGIQQIIQILIPVTICLVFVITTVTVITSYQKTNAGTLFESFYYYFYELYIIFIFNQDYTRHLMKIHNQIVQNYGCQLLMRLFS